MRAEGKGGLDQSTAPGAYVIRFCAKCDGACSAISHELCTLFIICRRTAYTCFLPDNRTDLSGSDRCDVSRSPDLGAISRVYYRVSGNLPRLYLRPIWIDRCMDNKDLAVCGLIGPSPWLPTDRPWHTLPLYTPYLHRIQCTTSRKTIGDNTCGG